MVYACVSVAIMVFWLPRPRQIKDLDPKLPASEGLSIHMVQKESSASQENRTLANNAMKGKRSTHWQTDRTDRLRDEWQDRQKDRHGVS